MISSLLKAQPVCPFNRADGCEISLIPEVCAEAVHGHRVMPAAARPIRGRGIQPVEAPTALESFLIFVLTEDAASTVDRAFWRYEVS